MRSPQFFEAYSQFMNEIRPRFRSSCFPIIQRRLCPGTHHLPTKIISGQPFGQGFYQTNNP